MKNLHMFLWCLIIGNSTLLSMELELTNYRHNANEAIVQQAQHIIGQNDIKGLKEILEKTQFDDVQGIALLSTAQIALQTAKEKVNQLETEYIKQRLYLETLMCVCGGTLTCIGLVTYGITQQPSEQEKVSEKYTINPYKALALTDLALGCAALARFGRDWWHDWYLIHFSAGRRYLAQKHAEANEQLARATLIKNDLEAYKFVEK